MTASDGTPLGDAEDSPEDAAKSKSNPLRCVACGENVRVVASDWVACKQCLARHHDDCWATRRACASCHATESLRTARRLAVKEPAWPVVAACLVVAGSVGSSLLMSSRRSAHLLELAERAARLEHETAERETPPVKHEAEPVAPAPPTPSSPEPEAPPSPGSLPAEVVTALPGTVERACVAGAGKYLVLKLTGIEGLAVYDTDERRLVKIVELRSTDFMYAAGGDTALVYFKQDDTFEAWDLRTFEKKSTGPNPFPGEVFAISMGHSRGGRALVLGKVGHARFVEPSWYLLRTATLTRIEGAEPVTIGGPGQYRPDGIALRSNGDLTRIVECTSGIPSVYTWTGSTYDRHRLVAPQSGISGIGEDGTVYNAAGEIFAGGQLLMTGRLDWTLLCPGTGGDLVLGRASDGRLSIYRSGDTTPIASCGDFPGTRPGPVRPPNGSADAESRMTFVPSRDRIVLLPDGRDRLVCRELDLKGALDRSGRDYLVVVSTPERDVIPGKEWEYNVKALSRSVVKFTLARSPDGMSVSPSGRVSWSVPVSLSKDEKVSLLVTDASGGQIFHNFTIGCREAD